MCSGFSTLHHSMKVSFLTAVISTRRVEQNQADHVDIILLRSPADPSKFPSSVVFKVHFNQGSLRAFILKRHTSTPKAVFQTLHSKMSSLLSYWIIEWFGLEWSFKDHLVPTPLQWVRTSSTRSACSNPHPTSPWKERNSQNRYQTKSRLYNSIFCQSWSYFGSLLRSVFVLDTFHMDLWIFSHTFTKNCKNYCGWSKSWAEQLSLLLVICMNNLGTCLQVITGVWHYCLDSVWRHKCITTQR